MIDSKESRFSSLKSSLGVKAAATLLLGSIANNVMANIAAPKQEPYVPVSEKIIAEEGKKSFCYKMGGYVDKGKAMASLGGEEGYVVSDKFYFNGTHAMTCHTPFYGKKGG